MALIRKPKPLTITGITTVVDQEADGRWIAEVPSLPGVLCYGATRAEAANAALALSLHVIADRLEHGEPGG